MTWKKRDVDPELYKIWSQGVRKRDKGRCQMPNCKKRGKQVHHIIRWADAPQLRYEIDNGILLCWDCHNEIKDQEGLYATLFTEIVASK